MKKLLFTLSARVVIAVSILGSAFFFIPTASANTITYSQDQCEARITSTTTISSSSVEISFVSILSKNYCVIVFKDVRTYQVTILGDSPTTADYLVVAGGGGGNSGGGGAGGFLEGTLDIENKTIELNVGVGGSGGSGGNYDNAPVGTSGGSSQLSNGVITIYAVGGGRGGRKNGGSITSGANGGSGGGAAWDAPAGTAGNGTTNQGFAGGSLTSGNYRGGGGGGGAGAVGSALAKVNSCGGPGGTGGIGKQSSITGIAIYYSGGGGGGVNSNCNNSTAHSGGQGGNGGGGKGSSFGFSGGTRGANANAAAGTANTGGGGGGTDPEDSGAGAGGSGVVILRYEIDSTPPTISSAPTISGVITIGETLTTTTGTWTNTPTSFSYQWSRADSSGGAYTNISGATSSTYNLVTADVGKYLKSTVTAINADGSALSTSDATGQIGKANQAAINITSTSASFGSDLSLTSTGGSTGGTFTYTVISGSCTIEGSTLTPTSSGTCVIRSSLEANTNYLAAQSADTTINISTTSVSATITLEPGALTYRQAKSVTASATVAGKVTFKVNGKVIPRCKKKAVLASASVICSYRPSTRGYVVITATLNPTDASYIGTTRTTSSYFVGNRSGRRAG